MTPHCVSSECVNRYYTARYTKHEGGVISFPRHKAIVMYGLVLKKSLANRDLACEFRVCMARVVCRIGFGEEKEKFHDGKPKRGILKELILVRKETYPLFCEVTTVCIICINHIIKGRNTSVFLFRQTNRWMLSERTDLLTCAHYSTCKTNTNRP